MNELLGIDLGTSSVKLLAWSSDGTIKRVKESYTELSPEGWWRALCAAFMQLDLTGCLGIGLCSQVGTYILNDNEVISWNNPAGSEELKEIQTLISEDEWVQEIGMIHPPLCSYPLPRIRYFQKKGKEICSLRMPKEELILRMTGELISDPWSWRGLANSEKLIYSEKLLNKLHVTTEILPPLSDVFAKAGTTGRLERDGRCILPAGIPVYNGMNDFFSSLVGMGIQENEIFDITGTSEHLGLISEKFTPDRQLPSGAYIDGFVHYGVTGSSGDSIRFADRLSPGILQTTLGKQQLLKCPPVFLPYLRGERAPVFDADASGVFFGIGAGADAQSMAYSAMEGVVFSLYHIYETLGSPEGETIKTVGGSAEIRLLNQLKAELFDLPVEQLSESDTSALGAVMTAGVGSGLFSDLSNAQELLCRTCAVTEPEKGYRSLLLERYEIYRELYPALKDTMHRFRRGQGSAGSNSI